MFFLDTYALVEVIKGNARYAPYLQMTWMTTKLNLMELYYTLLRLYDEALAEKWYQRLLPMCTVVSDDIVKRAMKLRLQQRKMRNLVSYVGCIGYCLALSVGMKFLTGEKHFARLGNVEFIR